MQPGAPPPRLGGVPWPRELAPELALQTRTSRLPASRLVAIDGQEVRTLEAAADVFKRATGDLLVTVERTEGAEEAAEGKPRKLSRSKTLTGLKPRAGALRKVGTAASLLGAKAEKGPKHVQLDEEASPGPSTPRSMSMKKLDPLNVSGKINDKLDSVGGKINDKLDSVGGKINDKMDSVGGNAGWSRLLAAMCGDGAHPPACWIPRLWPLPRTPERGPSRLDARGGLRSSPRAAPKLGTLAHPGKLRDVSDKIDVKKLDPLNVGGRINDRLEKIDVKKLDPLNVGGKYADLGRLEPLTLADGRSTGCSRVRSLSRDRLSDQLSKGKRKQKEAQSAVPTEEADEQPPSVAVTLAAVESRAAGLARRVASGCSSAALAALLLCSFTAQVGRAARVGRPRHGVLTLSRAIKFIILFRAF